MFNDLLKHSGFFLLIKFLTPIRFYGNGGGYTSGVQDSTTTTSFPSQYNSFLYNNKGQAGGGIFGLMADQMNQMPQSSAMLQGGGTAPTGGVFNGGATSTTPTAPIYAAGGQSPGGTPTGGTPAAPAFSSHGVSTAPLSAIK